MKEKENNKELEEAIISSQDRFDEIDKKIKLSTGDYGYQQEVLYDKVILEVKNDDTHKWFAYRLNEGIITPDDSLAQDVLAELADPEKAEEIISRGYNVVTSTLEEDIPLEEQTREIASRHFYGYLVQQGKLEQQDDTFTPDSSEGTEESKKP